MAREKAISTFIKGMNKDMDLSILPNTVYLNAENFRLIGDTEGTSGSLINIKGNSTSFNLSDASGVTSSYKVIGNVVVRNKIYMFLTNDTSANGGTGVIVSGNIDATTTVKIGSITTIYTSAELLFSTKYPITAIGRYENAEVIKLYWTDNFNTLRHINVADPDVASLAINKLDILPDTTLSQPTILYSKIGGALPVGRIQYAYQLYDKYGAETVFSPVSEHVHISSSSDTETNTEKYVGNSEIGTSNKQITLSISCDTSFDFIKVIGIYYEQEGSNPNIRIIHEGAVASTVYVIDSGKTNLGELTLEEFRTIGGRNFIAKTIETKDNFLLAGNIEEDVFYIADEDLDTRAYRFNSSGSGRVYETNTSNYRILDAGIQDFNVPIDHDAINYSNLDAYNLITPYMYQSDGQTIGGEGPIISYEIIREAIKIDNVNSYNDSYQTLLYGKYSGYADALKNDYKSYQRGEIYRFAIVFYNKKGQKTFPKWIADIRMPFSFNMAYSPGILSTTEGNRSDFPISYQYLGPIYGSALGIKFTIDWNRVSTSVKENIVAYEIVRSPREDRDKSILGNGLVSRLAERATDKYVCASRMMATTDEDTGYIRHEIGSGTIDARGQTIYEFICPEILAGNNLDPQPGDYLAFEGAVFGGSSYKGTSTYVTSLTNQPLNVIRKFGMSHATTSFAFNSSNALTWATKVEDANTGRPKHGIMEGIIHKANAVPYAAFDDNKFTVSLTDILPVSWVNDGAHNWDGYKCTSGYFDLDTNFGADVDVLPNKSSSSIVTASFNRPVTNQYGGNSYSQRKSAIYISIGAFKTTTTTGTDYKEVFGGDMFIGAFPILRSAGHIHDYDGNYPVQELLYYITESTINPELLSYKLAEEIDFNVEGDTTEVDFYIQETKKLGTIVNDTAYPDNIPDLYEYLHLYSAENTAQIFIPEPLAFTNTIKFDTKIVASEKKINGQSQDKWLKFGYNTEIDVDTTYGEIIKLINYNNYILFFQSGAVGTVAINERSVINDQQGSLILGSAGLLDRYDYITNQSGSMHGLSIITTPYGLFWFDVINSKVYKYTNNELPLSDVKGMFTYIKSLATSDLKTTDDFYNGIGIQSVFDPVNEEVLFNFKYSENITSQEILEMGTGMSSYFLKTEANSFFDDIPADTKILLRGTGGSKECTFSVSTDSYVSFTSSSAFTSIGSIGEDVTIKVYHNKVLAYNEIAQAFTSFYTYLPNDYIRVNELLLSSKYPETSQYYVHDYDSSIGNFYGGTKPDSTLKVAINQKYPTTKVFDSLELPVVVTDDNGIDRYDKFFNQIRVYNSYQNSDFTDIVQTTASVEEVEASRRNRTWKLQIPRNLVSTDITSNPNIFDESNLSNATRKFRERIRDKYVILDLVFENSLGYRINIPHIITNYRISQR